MKRVLKEAKKRRFIDFNPLDDWIAFSVDGPARSYLQLSQVLAVVEAARLLDAEERKLEWRDVWAIRATNDPATQLGFATGSAKRRSAASARTKSGLRPAARSPASSHGLDSLARWPRMAELCLLDRPDLDLAYRVLRIPRVKTDASERVMPMVPAFPRGLGRSSGGRIRHRRVGCVLDA